MSSRFNDLLKKAHGAIAQFRGGGANFFLGRNGEVVYSKNNVCVHEGGGMDEEQMHTPGYLTIQCSEDDQLGITLILQWLPNALLEKTPSSIRCVSPRRGHDGGEDNNEIARFLCRNRAADSEDEEETTVVISQAEQEMRTVLVDSEASTTVCAELNGARELEQTREVQSRPQTLGGLGIPSINLIPNTPVEQHCLLEENSCREKQCESSDATSGEDGEGEEEGEEEKKHSSDDDSEEDEGREKATSPALDTLRQRCAVSLAFTSSTPEEFAREHNLVLGSEEERAEQKQGREREQTRPELPQNTKTGDSLSGRTDGGTVGGSLFSVNLGKMRSMRIFYSDPERTSGQLVIASPDSQYKIFHFHHTGLEKLSQIFDKWDAIKSRSAGSDAVQSPSVVDRHLVICPGAETELAKAELDPEDGLYECISWDLWRSYVSKDGSVEDCFTIRKAIYFSAMESTLRKEVWPFLLRIYPWNSTLEQRDVIRNDLFLRYQRLKGSRMRRMARSDNFSSVEQSILKDVVRTDRRNSFFAGEENTNLGTMRSILLTYAVKYPQIGYIQGMSDLLAPLLSTLRDEPLAYWCFVQLMEKSLFSQPPPSEKRTVMELQLDYLRELLRHFTPGFYAHLLKLGEDALQLMFVHRWILLFFKREFPVQWALHIWEACWSGYRTNYFHLFIACAIVSIYGPDVVAQQLPHDEILLYFSSLAMHLDGRLILRKARGLLHQFYRLPRIPCSMAGLCLTDMDSEQWSSIAPHRQFECTQMHGDEPCPFADT